jgi:hypothetical protein
MITANMCSIPERQEMAIKAILSIKDQVDVMNVYLNYPYDVDISKLIAINGINILYTDPKKGDVNKFYEADEKKGFQFMCDDDIIYPSSYVQDTLPHLQKFGVVSYHGKNLTKKVNSFYKDVVEKFHFLSTLKNVRIAEICGTGVCAYDADKIVIRPRKFRYPNMSDIYFSSFFEGIMILPHDENYFFNMSDTGIFNEFKDSDFYQTYEFNRLFR